MTRLWSGRVISFDRWYYRRRKIGPGIIARELAIKFQMSPKHPMVQLNKAYR